MVNAETAFIAEKHVLPANIVPVEVALRPLQACLSMAHAELHTKCVTANSGFTWTASALMRTLESMYYGWRCRTRQNDKTKYDSVATTPACLRLFESFLEAAPQLCFQLYVVFRGVDDESGGTLLFNAGVNTDSG
nr:hypothetical protein BaRGS_021803 [Batillaria attramentaria]